jgi:hypothetical protein
LASGKVVFGHAIDHFKAIRNSPAELAYEWSSLRRGGWGVIDNHKGNAVIPEDHDPTRLQGDALVLTENLDGLLIVVPNPRLPQAEQARLANTVDKLGLNQSAVALARKDCYDDFIANGTTYGHEFMQERQPFVFQFIFAAP